MREVPAAEWGALLERLGNTDAYLRRGYLEASALLTPGAPVLLHEEGPGGDVAFALLRRDDPVDLTTPYGYGGPVAAGPDPPLDAFWRGYEAWCAEHGAVSTFAVLHPVLANRALLPETWDVRALGDTIAWDLTGPDPAERMHAHHRRLVRKALREGAEASVHTGDGLGGFPALYAETMTRNDADPFYLFGDEYWAALGETPVARVDVTRGDELLASVLLLVSPPGIHYHLGASSAAGRSLGASHLALFESARWGAGQGGTTLHLGGGVGGREDGLLRWKERFDPGGRRASWMARRVHLADRYADLTGGADPHAEGFFPAYRDRS